MTGHEWRMAALYVAAVLIALTLMASSAEAQGGGAQCQDRTISVAKLESQYGESQVAYGTEHRGALMEIWVNRENGTWTMFLTLPNGMACLIAHGDDFETFAVASGHGLPL